MITRDVSFHIADKGSDLQAATVARRGGVAGKRIGRADIDEHVWHQCVVPDDVAEADAYDYIVADFETTTVPLADTTKLQELDVQRAQVVQRRADAAEALRQGEESRLASEAATKERAEANKAPSA